MTDHKPVLASAVVGGSGWISWFLAHIQQINSVLQFFILLGTLVGMIVAYRIQRKKP